MPNTGLLPYSRADFTLKKALFFRCRIFAESFCLVLGATLALCMAQCNCTRAFRDEEEGGGEVYSKILRGKPPRCRDSPCQPIEAEASLIDLQDCPSASLAFDSLPAPPAPEIWRDGEEEEGSLEKRRGRGLLQQSRL